MATTPTPTPTPTPARGTGKTKKWWMIHVAAGVVMVALVAICVTQCSGKKEDRAEKEAKQSELAKANACVDSLRSQVQEMHAQIDGLKSDNTAKSDTIAVQRDSIATLNDSLLKMHAQIDGLKSDNTAKSDTIAVQRDSIATLNDSLLIVNEELTDCRNSKRKPRKKSARVKPAPVNRGCASKTNISLDNSQNNGNNVVVNTPAVQAAVDTLNNVTVKRTIYIKCIVEREY